VTERGYSVAEVTTRVGVSTHSLYKWVKAVSPDKTEQQAVELLQAKSELLRLPDKPYLKMDGKSDKSIRMHELNCYLNLLDSHRVNINSKLSDENSKLNEDRHIVCKSGFFNSRFIGNLLILIFFDLLLS